MTADVFISFASKDRKVAMTLCQSLERRGVKCWISARDILAGENFQVAIVQAIRNARILLLVFTANSNNSEEMTKELALASQQKMIVIPLRVEDVTPSDAFTYEFATRQWIDAFADWEFAIDQLVQRITNALALVAPVQAAVETPELNETPAPAVLPLGEIVRKAKASAAHVDDAAATHAAAFEAEAPAKRPVNRLLLIAAGLAAVVGLGLVVSNLTNARTKASAPVLAMARVQAAEAAPAPQALVATAPVAAAPVAEAAVEAYKPAEPQPKRKPRKPQPETVHSDIPY